MVVIVDPSRAEEVTRLTKVRLKNYRVGQEVGPACVGGPFTSWVRYAALTVVHVGRAVTRSYQARTRSCPAIGSLGSRRFSEKMMDAFEMSASENAPTRWSPDASVFSRTPSARVTFASAASATAGLRLAGSSLLLAFHQSLYAG